MNLNNYALVENHVQQIISDASQKNEAQVLEYVKALSLANKSIEEQVEKLYSESLNMVRVEETFERPEYISLARYPETIIKIIYHRLLFAEKNECHLLEEANLINQKKVKIHQLLESAKANLPMFTFDDFIQGKYNVIFYKLKQRPDLTSEDEYNKMRTWQNDQLVNALLLEANHFIKAFQKIIQGEKSISDHIGREILQLQTIFKEGKVYSANQLVSELFKLNGFSNSLMPDDLSVFHKSMIKFLDNNADHSSFTPQNLNKIIAKYRQHKATPFISYPPLLCYSLILYGDWLQLVADGKMDVNSSLNLNFRSLFDQTAREAIKQADEKIKNFDSKVTALNTADEFKDIILAELDNLRVSLKEKNVRKYYYHLSNEQEAKSLFISNCIFGGNPENQSSALKQAIIIAEETDFFLAELADKYFDQVLMKSLKTLPTVNLQIIDVINSMVPDSVLIQKMLAASSKAIGELSAEKKPALFILQDLNESLLEIYNSLEELLMKYLARLNDDVRYEYATHTIRGLNEKCRLAKQNKYDLVSHIETIKDILQQELHLVKSITKPVDLTQLLKQKPVEEKKFNFGYSKSTTKPIEDIVQALVLNREIDFLDYRTSPKDLVALLTTKDIDNLPNTPIYINCQTQQFRYIIVKFKSLLPKFNPTTIEKSGRFFSKSGSPFAANNLNPSKIGIPKAKVAIDQIFNKVQ
ncbi:MAG: hypothetical protein JNK09_21895 [Prolixibacteraceae bacterium]|nr:hypothetical protein [Prolixibacteraceae bacterium]